MSAFGSCRVSVINRPFLTRSSYGCDKCPHDLVWGTGLVPSSSGPSLILGSGPIVFDRLDFRPSGNYRNSSQLIGPKKISLRPPPLQEMIDLEPPGFLLDTID